MRSFIAAVACVVALAANAQQTITLNGFFTARGVNTGDHRSWLEGGQGRFDARGTDAFALAHVGVDWNPSEHFDAHVSALARREPTDFGGDRVGVVEAYVDAIAGGFRLRAGQFFLPTSRENKGELWTSPYSISFSALNTWIGEEVRPIAVDLQWRSEFYWTVGATAFRGNDTSGTLLAWRGWAIGDRLSVYNEGLPLPPLRDFAGRQGAETHPFRSDLDGRTGFAERVRFTLPERANIQLLHFDNRGDRLLYGDEYSWATRYNQLSGEIGSASPTTLAAEYMSGKTGMGVPQLPHVQTDFAAWYALVSHKRGRNRFTARLENFSVTDRAHASVDVHDDHGRAWTLAWLYDVTPKVRAAVEFVQISGTREVSYDARKVSLEVRYSIR